jgi:chemotaxis protein MotA
LAIIGIVVVFGAVLGGYLREHGKLLVLVQPAELVIIGMSAVGTLLIGNPLPILKKISAGLGGVFKGSKFTTERYLESLKLYELFNRARRLRLPLSAVVHRPLPRKNSTGGYGLSHFLCTQIDQSHVASKSFAIRDVKAFH